MLLKGIDEVRQRARARCAAAEMVLLRLAYVASCRRRPSSRAAGSAAGMRPRRRRARRAPAQRRHDGAAVAEPPPAPCRRPSRVPQPARTARAGACPAGVFAEAVDAVRAAAASAMLAAWLYQAAHLVRFEPGRIELRLGAGRAARPGRPAERGCSAAGPAGAGSIVGRQAPRAPTLAEQAAAAKASGSTSSRHDPRVRPCWRASPEPGSSTCAADGPVVAGCIARGRAGRGFPADDESGQRADADN